MYGGKVKQMDQQCGTIEATKQVIYKMLLESSAPAETAKVILGKVRFPPKQRMSSEALKMVQEVEADLLAISAIKRR